MKDFDSLNEEQKKAVEQIDGPVLLVAGAGTGKTMTLTSRIQYLIKKGVHPEKILAITFTNKAAEEMRNRVMKGLKNHQSWPFIRTFHSLAVFILRENHNRLNLPKHFPILDQGASRALVKEAIISLDYDLKHWDPRKIQSIISKAKGAGKNPPSLQKDARNPVIEVAALVWEKYEELKKEERALDFDDLLVKSLDLLNSDESIRNYYQDKWHYIHIDEYQDTNNIQYKIVKTISAPQNNIFAVGDGDQNIYSWRGADLQNILNFEKDFKSAKTMVLDQNYRSTKNILNAADEVIAKNKERIPKKLKSNKEVGEKITLYTAFSENDEADWIASKSEELIRCGIKENSIAVLFRTNFQSRVLEESFLHKGVAYQLVGTKFFERKEIKDMLSYLRASLSSDSLSDIKRIINVPKRGIGKATIVKIFSGDENSLSPKMLEKYRNFQNLLERIQKYAWKNKLSDTIKYIVEKSGMKEEYSKGSADEKDRLENIKELVTFATKYDELEPEQALEKFIEETSLLSDQDMLGQKREREDAVKLMTIHAAKGLEFDYVFIAGLEQGLFPSERDDGKNKYEKEEERRLCYVAITRAQKKVFLSYAQTRTIYGSSQVNVPSEFIDDIPEEIIEYEDSVWNNDDDKKTIYLDF